MASNSGKKELTLLQHVGLSAPGRTLFRDVNLSLQTGESIVVRGSSGNGKSQLLKIIAGQNGPDEGRVVRKGGVTQEYVSATFENQPTQAGLTIREYFLEGRGLRQLETKKRELENVMAAGDNSPKVLGEYGEVLDRFEKQGGYTAETEIEETLDGLRVSKRFSGHITPDSRLNQVSSGQRTKLAIGRALFSDAQLVILDDPTAHLDDESVEWLNRRLAGQSDKAVIVASNDDRIAKRAASQILQIENTGRVLAFRGSLVNFEKIRKSQLEAERIARITGERRHDKLEKTYNKFKNKGDFRRSKDFARTGAAMRTRIEWMDEKLADMPTVPQEPKQRRQNVLQIRDSQRPVADSSLIIDMVQKTFNGKGGVDTSSIGEIRVKKGDRLVVAGQNGSGKSTLLRMIANEAAGDNKFKPDRGMIVFNSRQKVGYMSPDRLELKSNRGVIDEVTSSMDQANEGRAIAILSSMGFDSHRVRTQKVQTLSAGEKQQLALAKLIAGNPDVLILDEPTSNLRPDIKSRLARALNEYEGTLIMVDHDPDFIEQLNVTQRVDLSKKSQNRLR